MAYQILSRFAVLKNPSFLLLHEPKQHSLAQPKTNKKEKSGSEHIVKKLYLWQGGLEIYQSVLISSFLVWILAYEPSLPWKWP